MIAKWYIINVLSGYEKKVIGLIKENALKKHVADAFKDFVVPVENTVEIKKGKKEPLGKQYLSLPLRNLSFSPSVINKIS